MSDLWAIYGLFSIDADFRDELLAVKDDPEKLTEKTRAFGFKLTRFDVAECAHTLKDTVVMNHFEEIGKRWTRPDCTHGIVFRDSYSHAYELFRDPKIKSALERERADKPDGDLEYLKKSILAFEQ